MKKVAHAVGNVPLIQWETNVFEPAYTPVQRCLQVSSRFERFEDSQRQSPLNYITDGRINDCPVICCVRETPGTGCVDNSGLLLTLLPGDDPNRILEDLMRVNNFDGNAVNHACPEYDNFGWSVAIDENSALICSDRDNDHGSCGGSAYYLFDTTTGSGVSGTREQHIFVQGNNDNFIDKRTQPLIIATEYFH